MAKEPLKKIRKRRKPMTTEQKAKAAESLAKARAAREKNNPPEHKSIHPIALARPEDDPFYFRKVQQWIKTQKDLLGAARKELRLGLKGSEARVANHQAYIRNLERYLRDGEYTDDFYGEYGQNKIKWKCVKPAYDKHGNIKRTHGVFYSDLGGVWSDYDGKVSD